MAATAEPQLTTKDARTLVEAGFAPDLTKVKTSLSPVVKAAAELYRNNDPNALRVLSGEVIPFSTQDVQRALIQNLSSERDRTTKQKVEPKATNTAESARYTSAKEMAENTRVFLEQGTVSDVMVKPTRRYLENDPRFKAILDDQKTDNKKDAYTMDLMTKFPGYKEKVRQRYITALDPQRRLTDTESAVRSLEGEIAVLQARTVGQLQPNEIPDAKKAVLDAQGELGKLNKEQFRLQQRERQYKSEEKTAANNKTQMGKLEADVISIRFNITAKENDLQVELAKANPDANKVATLQSEIANLQSNNKLVTYNNLDNWFKTYYNPIEKKIISLKTKLAPKEQALDAAKAVLTELQAREKAGLNPQGKAEIDAQIQEKRLALADAKSLHESAMIKYAGEILNLPATAMEDFLNDSFTNLKQVWEEEAKKDLEKKAKDKEKQDEREKALAESGAAKLENSWKKLKERKVGKQKVKIFETDLASVTSVLSDMMNPVTKDLIMKDHIEAIKAIQDTDKTFSRKGGALLVGLGITLEEAKALKKQIGDADWLDAQKQIWRGKAISDYFLAGGEMNGAITRFFAGTDEGKELLEAALKRAETTATTSEALKGEARRVHDVIKSFNGKVDAGNWKMIAGYLIAALLMGGAGMTVGGVLLGGLAAALGAGIPIAAAVGGVGGVVAGGVGSVAGAGAVEAGRRVYNAGVDT